MNAFRPHNGALAICLLVALPSTFLAVLHVTGNLAYNRALVRWVDFGGETEIEALFAPMVPEEENAAPIIREIGKVLEGMTKEESDRLNLYYNYEGNKRIDEHTIQPRPSNDSMEELLERYAPALYLMCEAADRPYCRWEPGKGEELWGRLKYFRRGIKLLAAQAEVQLARGDEKGAAETLILGFRLSRHLLENPFLIDHLIWMASYDILLSTIERMYGNRQAPFDNTLELVEAPRIGDRETFRAFKSDMTSNISTNPLEEFEFLTALHKEFNDEETSYFVYLYYSEYMRGWNHHTRGIYISHWIRYLNEHFDSKIINPSHRPWWAFNMIPQFLKARTKRLCTDAEFLMARTALHLREYRNLHGAYPPTFPMPLDPLTDYQRPFDYLSNGESFILYAAEESACGESPSLNWYWN